MNRLMELLARQQAYGKRADGTQKDRGYLGELQTPRGDIMTEYSVNIDGREVPSVIPTLHPAELNYILQTEIVPRSVDHKLYKHARERVRQGKSPFWTVQQDYK
jgi:hypothetical protein